MTGQVKDSEYYFEAAERCLRWSLLLRDKRRIDELEELAEDYFAKARRLQSIERAASRTPVTVD